MHMQGTGQQTSEPGALKAVLPVGWPRPQGYSQAIHVPPGRSMLFVAGQIGWDVGRKLVSTEFLAQFEQALRNCVSIVEAAGGTAEDIVRLTMYCVDRRAYAERLSEVGEAYRRVMGRNFPAMSLVEVAALLEEGALIEIEATAALRAEGERRPG